MTQELEDDLSTSSNPTTRALARSVSHPSSPFPRPGPIQAAFILIVLLAFVTILRLSVTRPSFIDSATTKSVDVAPSDPSSPRVAICFTGNARTFHYPLVHEAIYKNVIQPLRREYPTDIFFNIKLSDDPRPRRPSASSEDDANLAAIRSFDPVHVLLLNSSHDFVSSRIMDAEQRWITAPDTCPDLEKRDAMLPHSLFRSMQCKPLIEQREQSLGFRYKWIYRARPDVVFLEAVVPPSKLSNTTVIMNKGPTVYAYLFVTWWHRNRDPTVPIPMFADHFMAGMRDDMMVALDAFHAVDDCAFYQVGKRNSEAALGFWVVSRGLQIVVYDWVWVLVRAVRGPECYRIKLLHIRNPARHQQMMDACQAFFLDFHREYSDGPVPSPPTSWFLKRSGALPEKLVPRIIPNTTAPVNRTQ